MRNSSWKKLALALALVATAIVAVPLTAGANKDGRSTGNVQPVAPVGEQEAAPVEEGWDGDGPEPRVLHTSSTYIQGSLCVGFDCVNNSAFGFDTIRLEENNLRIKFTDTSVAASFPTNDWQIRINDSSNGGASYFAVEDVTGARTPFRVDAGAPNNSLRVDSQGDVGINQASPALELHITDGDSPSVRLEQDGSNGFTPQTWDVAGNEANFFIRDVTNGSQLPIRIRPDSPTNSIIITADDSGRVGFGTSSPDAAMHLRRTDGTAQLHIEEASTTNANRVILNLENNGGAQFEMNDSSGGDSWRIGLVTGAPNPLNDKLEITEQGSAGRFRFFKDGRFDVRGTGNVTIFDLDDNGDLDITGDLTANGTLYPSDRNLKARFAAVDAKSVLDKVVALDISTWAYKNQLTKRHIGPMAQDWYAAFGLGSTDTLISQTDVNGVLLASVQALAAENAALRATNSDMAKRLAALEAQMEALLGQLGG